MKTKIFSIIIISLLIFAGQPLNVLAAPAVNSAAGSFIHGQNITISGSGFGTKNPAAPLMWDDGEAAAKTTGDPTKIISVGGWYDGKPDASSVKQDWRMQYRYSGWKEIATPHSRSTKYMVGGHWNNYTEQAENVGLTIDNGTIPDYWYATWYIRLNWKPTTGNSCWFGVGNYKEYTWQTGAGMYNGNFAYSATAGGYRDVANGISTSINHNPNNFCAGFPTLDSPARQVESTKWIKREIIAKTTVPGSLKSYSYNGTAKEIVYNATCSSGALFNANLMRSFSVGGFAACTAFDSAHLNNARGLLNVNYHEWIRSGVGIDQYYLRLKGVAGDTNPDIDRKPDEIWINSNRATEGNGAVGLNAGEWDYGDFDSLGFSTVYVRLAGGESPETHKPTECFIYIKTLSSTQREDPDNWRYFDDVYIDRTPTRAVLANNSSYDSATIVEPQIPSVWADGSVTAKVNLGKLPDSGNAYLFVFDSNNQANSVGYPVTLGSGGGDTTPPAVPTGVTVN